MAKKKRSVLKRQRQEIKRRLRNKMIKSKIKTLIKKTKEAILNNNPDFNKILKETIKEIDKAVAKGIIHKNNGARKKSRLMKFIKKYRIQLELEKK
ncbi:MAG: 30S ribosomal protein S20 [Candidatus Omnitrophica bacterium]|nr:30S ribosomal protein S20 [Candidatus Omnitrophota bacterium]MCM8809676.1 30S ribosomal protein S20 [Candidatus Omnitrophota bacterium]MCM8810554.1 30S ribosomal protein S20 [Candidatus Omnitrophota bacterium]MCM8832513.1 30S ribosomal protein S20 [Candidatus Omnitrophota bacterium]